MVGCHTLQRVLTSNHDAAEFQQVFLRMSRFSNRPFGVKRFQAIHHYSVDVAHGLVLL